MISGFRIFCIIVFLAAASAQHGMAQTFDAPFDLRWGMSPDSYQFGKATNDPLVTRMNAPNVAVALINSKLLPRDTGLAVAKFCRDHGLQQIEWSMAPLRFFNDETGFKRRAAEILSSMQSRYGDFITQQKGATTFHAWKLRNMLVVAQIKPPSTMNINYSGPYAQCIQELVGDEKF